jgi:hypothetical protein
MSKSNPAYANVFYVLDFDRTLASTDKFHDILETVIEQETTIKVSQLRTARQVAERAGESFDTVEYLRQFLKGVQSEKTWYQIQQIFIRQAQKRDLLEPGAAELFRILNERKLPYGIITFGGEAWQLAKIEAAQLMDVPHVVTHIQEKGRILSGWKHEGGQFIIPPALTRDFQPLYVSKIVFLDDKPKSFIDIPDGVQGLHIRPLAMNRIPGSRPQFSSLPSQVKSVVGLQGAVDLLFSE